MRPAPAVAGLGGGNRFDPGAHVLVRGGTVARSAKWQSPGAPLVLAGEVYVDGEAGQRATLELVPGLELRFTEAGALLIGYYSLAGLNARGTAEAAITFTAHERREAGGWRGVGVHGQGEANIERALFEFGGKAADEGALFVRGGSLSLTGTTFRSDVIGVSLDDAAKLTAFADNTFVATPVALALAPEHIGGLGEGNAYDRDSRIKSRGGAVKGKATWRAQGATLELAGEVYVDEGELSIDAGVALLAGPDAQLTIGSSARGTLRVRGTVASPVTIGPAETERATWRGCRPASRACSRGQGRCTAATRPSSCATTVSTPRCRECSVGSPRTRAAARSSPAAWRCGRWRCVGRGRARARRTTWIWRRPAIGRWSSAAGTRR